MSLISITIEDSEVEVVAGIPKYVILTTNIPSTIFFTLDGSNPDTNSSIYISSIFLPTENLTLTLFATNGTDTSAIISKDYITTIAGPKGAVKVDQDGGNIDLFPFGSRAMNIGVPIDGNTGITVAGFGEELVTFDGYDGTATNMTRGGTNEPLSAYELIFSDSDKEGTLRGHGIGTLPSTTTIQKPAKVPNSSDANSAFFNPRAMVIYQDSRKEPYDKDVSQLNRQYFSTLNTNVADSGANLYNTAWESNIPRGTFLRSHYNPRDQSITYYYIDTSTGRWIISTEPAVSKPNAVNDLSGIIFNARNNSGCGLVFNWLPFQSRRLI